MRKNIIPALFVISLLLTSGCARLPATFRVLDEKTKEPITGAVAIAWWSSYRGLPGLSYGVTDKVVERETGPDGTFKIPLILGRLAGQVPRIKVYKPGYVGWDNRYVYMGHWKNDIKISREMKRGDFKYKSQDIYLERWKDEYSHISHDSFLSREEPLDIERIGLKRLLYNDAIRHEVPFILLEEKALRQKGIK
jgi:hypothetical protein